MDFLLLAIIFGFLTACATSRGPNSLLSPHRMNGMIMWTERDCKGIPASTIFDITNFAKNISNACLSRSFEILRPLQGEEQLDISLAQKPGLWQSKNDQLGLDSLPCTDFIQSYFPLNGSGGCYNTPPFTCHRLWKNSGLADDLRAPEKFQNWTLPSPLPLLIPSSCSRVKSLIPSSEPLSTLAPINTPASSKTSPSPASSKSNIAQHTPDTNMERVHTVKINSSNSTLFNPMYLDDIPSGHVIKFQSNEPFQLINSTFDDNCVTVHEFSTGSELFYDVTRTEPVWFFACPPRGALCHCNQDTHFALNPGDQLKAFEQKIKQSNWDISRPTLKSWVTETETVTVYPTGTE
ncbi:uncharacterized protein BDV17DRAFT_297398 [Aspergillus undulatus]|uniref:uncharacterized protein n=1 Tax=Aspergillus undulatus TaxID=1810928 RepID=UPI003CCCDF4C